MQISTITVHGAAGWPGLCLEAHGSQLTAVYGPSNSGKSTIAALLGHALFGKSRAELAGTTLPDGELVVEGDERRYRLRRVRDAQHITRLTVAALDRAPVDHHTMRQLVGNLPPSILAPLCAVSFRESPNIGPLLSKEFARGFQTIQKDGGPQASRRAAELAARRDLLAHELETRIASDRRASGELESRWRELDRQTRNEQQHLASIEQRLQSVERSLAETDARLRYRRLELNVELRWRADEGQHPAAPLNELDTQIERCRQTLAETDARESIVRSRLAQLQTARPATATIADQQTWLAVSRQLAADLSGEISRLARASASQSCVCHDAHPRLRPIAETIERQLAVLEDCIADQRRALGATELQGELDGLARTQTELRRQLEQLLARRQSHMWDSRTARDDSTVGKSGFSAADAEQLENRRLELEQERFTLAEQVAAAAKKLKSLRGERDAVERQRAALLSVRSIDHVQRELAAVQQKLEQATGGTFAADQAVVGGDDPTRASDFLAQLTGGDLVRLALTDHGRQACVVNREGSTVAVEHLNGTQRDQVYLSLCLTLLSAAARQGVWLPLVLDEPFERMDARGTAALVAVLDAFCRQGHQVFVFTHKQDAAERLASVGAALHNIANLRRREAEAATPVAPSIVESRRDVAATPPAATKTPNGEILSTEYEAPRPRRRKKKPADHSDAA